MEVWEESLSLWSLRLAVSWSSTWSVLCSYGLLHMHAYPWPWSP